MRKIGSTNLYYWHLTDLRTANNDRMESGRKYQSMRTERKKVAILDLRLNGIIMSISKKLLDIASQLDRYSDYETPELEALAEAAESVGKSWSKSTLGYHSRVYYTGFQPSPIGAAFDTQWGLDGILGIPSQSDKNWVEYHFEDVKKVIREKAENPDDYHILPDRDAAVTAFEKAKSAVISLVYANYPESDSYMQGLLEKIETAEIKINKSSIQAHLPQGQKITSDKRAVAEGSQIPPHIAVLKYVLSVKQPFQSCKDLKKRIVEMANHIQNIEEKGVKEKRIGTNVFIGHGRSQDWRELKDFINDKLKLPWDEFNRVPIAGIANIARLEQMLDEACMAFLVMTAEDEQIDGTLHARENVIHEAGLFQGKLGFERAIILLEEGCQEFSNIHGLGQIRFPKGNIKAAFEDIREVLKREEIIV